MSASKFLVVFNPLPNRRRTKRLEKLVEKLNVLELDYCLYPTAPTVSANRVFFDKNHQQYTDVIVVGGDGTFHLMANVLLDYHFNVGLLPAGTGNDFARAWYGDMRNDLNYLLDTVTIGSIEQIHLGYCQFLGNPKKSSSKAAPTVYFHNVLGVGFDAAIARSLRHSKGRVPSLSYLIAAIWYIPFYREPTCQIRGVNNSQPYLNFMTAFANSRFFGSGLPIAPDAEPSRKSLQLVKLAKQGLFTKFSLLIKLLFGKHTNEDCIEMAELTQPVYVDTVGLDVEADGEYLGQTPCKIGTTTRQLRLKRLQY